MLSNVFNVLALIVGVAMAAVIVAPGSVAPQLISNGAAGFANALNAAKGQSAFPTTAGG